MILGWSLRSSEDECSHESERGAGHGAERGEREAGPAPARPSLAGAHPHVFSDVLGAPILILSTQHVASQSREKSSP